jgi:hypothetical protein
MYYKTYALYLCTLLAVNTALNAVTFRTAHIKAPLAHALNVAVKAEVTFPRTFIETLYTRNNNQGYAQGYMHELAQALRIVSEVLTTQHKCTASQLAIQYTLGRTFRTLLKDELEWGYTHVCQECSRGSYVPGTVSPDTWYSTMKTAAQSHPELLAILEAAVKSSQDALHASLKLE